MPLRAAAFRAVRRWYLLGCSLAALIQPGTGDPADLVRSMLQLVDEFQ